MQNLKRIIKYIIPYKWFALLNFLSNLLSSLFNVFSLVMIVPMLELIFKEDGTSESLTTGRTDDLKGKFFDWLGNLIVSYTEGETGIAGKEKALVAISVGIILVFFLKNAFRYIGMYFLATIRSGVVRDLRESIYKKILTTPVAGYNEKRKGDILSRITGDVQEVEFSVMNSLGKFVKEPINIILFFTSLLIMNPQLTLFLVIVLPITGFVISYVGKSLKRTSSKTQEKLGQILTVAEETISGLRIVRLFSAEPLFLSRFQVKNDRHKKLMERTYRKKALAGPLSEVLTISALALVIWYGGKGVLQAGDNTVHEAAVFINYIMAFAALISPIKAFTTSLYDIKKGAAAEERIHEFMMSENPILESEEPVNKRDLQHGVEFKDITFQFLKEDPLFKDFNLFIPKGKTVALVGKSGSGKTTLANLITRFLDVNKGGIYFDDVDVKDLSFKSLRNLISIVTQHSILFNDTVLNNIALGDAYPDPHRAMEAAKVANAHGFIEALENGYDTNLGEGGGRLSGGQQQRLCIARAVYRNPEILILDEATSSLDTASEQLVQEALDNVMKNRTSVVIAHRLSTIQNADIIIVLDKGKIIEQGSHQELIAKNGAYAELISMQASC